MATFETWKLLAYFIPQALASSGAQLGIGSMLVRVAATLFCVEAEVTCVVAAAPVRTRTARSSSAAPT